jgi:hypothetical protein
MMRKLIKAPLSSLLATALFLTGNVYAGVELEAINAKVEETAAQLDATYGVLLTTQERADLKRTLIVSKVANAKKEDGTALNVAVETEAAIETYEITDPMNQRKLLIEFEVHVNGVGGSAGVEPQ